MTFPVGRSSFLFSLIFKLQCKNLIKGHKILKCQEKTAFSHLNLKPVIGFKSTLYSPLLLATFPHLDAYYI